MGICISSGKQNLVSFASRADLIKIKKILDSSKMVGYEVNCNIIKKSFLSSFTKTHNRALSELLFRALSLATSVSINNNNLISKKSLLSNRKKLVNTISDYQRKNKIVSTKLSCEIAKEYKDKCLPTTKEERSPSNKKRVSEGDVINTRVVKFTSVSIRRSKTFD
jgi:hypothetical protein